MIRGPDVNGRIGGWDIGGGLGREESGRLWSMESAVGILMIGSDDDKGPRCGWQNRGLLFRRWTRRKWSVVEDGIGGKDIGGGLGWRDPGNVDGEVERMVAV